MSTSESVTLIARPGPGVLVTVMDPAFATLAESLDPVELELAPGLYQLRFQQGRSVRDQIVSLTAGEGVREIASPHIDFASTTPLPGTKHAFAVHAREAESLSRSVHLRAGEGGELFVFLHERDRRGRGSLARGLSLHALTGERLVDFAATASVSAESAPHPWTGATVALDPGPYRLRAVAPGFGSSLEQVVWIEAGWQTQVLLVRTSTGRSRAPKLTGATVLMAPLGEGFSAAAPEPRLAEVARQALADRHTVMSNEDLAQLFGGDMRDPMLLLYAGHLELLRRPPDEARVRRLTERLTAVMPKHPDVRALCAWAGDTDRAPFPFPPMLRTSWRIVVEASARRTAAVPPDSFAAQIAEQLFGTGAWLTWRTPSGRRRHSGLRSATSIETSLPVALESLSGALRDAGSVELTPLEAEVSSLLAAPVPSADDADVVRALGVPLQVAQEAVATLAEKLSVDLGPPR